MNTSILEILLIFIVGFIFGYFTPRKLELCKIYIKEININRRLKKAIEKWNNDLDFINKKCVDCDSYFKWNQLVWQEISMYCRLNEQIEIKEFDSLCKRRGFDNDMKTYLFDMLKYLGLFDNYYSKFK